MDSDGVFLGNEFKWLMRGLKKLVRYVTPGRHELHPVERYNRTLMDRVRAMLAHSGLDPKWYLPFALETAARLYQITPVNGITPFELRFGRKSDVSFV